MKTHQLFRFVLILVIVLSAFSVISAQDQELVAPDNLEGSFIMDITTGNFATNDDGSYSLVLEGVSDRAIWVSTTPERASGLFTPLNFAGSWAVMEGLETEAILQTDELVIQLILSAPEYNIDDASVTYTATVENVAFTTPDPNSKEEAAIPSKEFENATLFVFMSPEFNLGLAQGSVLRLEGTRPSGVSNDCTPGITC